jgi:predicted dehydrogenase
MKIKIIQIGIGNRGDIWLESIAKSPVFELVACVEVSERFIAEQSAKHNIPRDRIFPSLEAALAQVKADAVLDVTPPAFHQAIATAALDAGLPILAEKPLADSIEAAEAIVQKVNASGLPYLVAQNYRYKPAIQTLKQALQTMGEIASVEISFCKAVRFGGYREEMPYPLIIDMSIHHFDLMRYLLNSNPVLISGQSWNPSWSWFKGDAAAALTLRFANRAIVTYHTSWTATGLETSWDGDWRFNCEKGVVELKQDKVTVQRFLGLNGNLHRYSAPEIMPEVALPLEPVPYLLQAFYEHVTNKTQPETSAQDNIHSIRMVFDAIRAFEAGVPVKV